jgi:hypothetical protein
MTDARPAVYPFSFYDLMRRRWTRARYVASLDDLAARYDCFRIEGRHSHHGQFGIN